MRGAAQVLQLRRNTAFSCSHDESRGGGLRAQGCPVQEAPAAALP
jgi:hypothetical protein